MSSNESHNWSDLAASLYEQLTGKNAEIIYNFEGLKVGIPSGAGSDAKHAFWHIDGTLRIHTRTHDGS